MSPQQRLILWTLVNQYTEACGGDTSYATCGSRRMDVVASLEREIDFWLKRASRDSAALASVSPMDEP